MTYLDHAATTPMLPEAVEAMCEAMLRTGNASSLHAAGRRARRGGRGVARAASPPRWAPGRPRWSSPPVAPRATTSPSRASTGPGAADPAAPGCWSRPSSTTRCSTPCDWLGEHEGAEVRWLRSTRRPGAAGDAARRAGRGPGRAIALVTVMWANNEVGTVKPIRELAAIAPRVRGAAAHRRGAGRRQLPVDFAASGRGALTLTGHKLGGPLGVGALLLGREVALHAAAARRRAGARRALRHAGRARPSSASRPRVELAVGDAPPPRRSSSPRCATSWSRRVLAVVPDAMLNGDPGTGDLDAAGCPATRTCRFPGCEGDALLMLLDAQGIECSTGSACSAGVAQPSHVLLAMGADEATARGSLRFSLGHTSHRGRRRRARRG